jgi:Flp pilus assembly protein TadG
MKSGRGTPRRFANSNPLRQRGSSLVEFALVITILFMLIFGIMDFSRAAYTYNFLSGAASSGARYAIVRGATCTTWTTACPAVASDITSYVQGIVPAGIQVTSAATCPSSPSSAAGALTVCATWPGTAGSGSPCTETSGKANTPGCVVQVQVQYAFKFSLPFLPRSSTYTMSATSRMVISQ